MARTGLVVAGAGARGAYEAGALSVLVPRMAALGAPPEVLVGTSAGALNVVTLAGLQGLGWEEAGRRLVELWSTARLDQVVDVSASLLADGVRYGGQLLGLPVRLPSLLDTTRQRDTLAALLPLDGLHDAVAAGAVAAVAVVTTSVSTGGTVVFVERAPGVDLPPQDLDRGISYVETELTVDHVLASAAVPVAFRPVRVEQPSSAAGWYVDGGLRLNVPLSPALALGCRRLGVVATHPSTWRGPSPVTGPPDVFAVSSLALTSLLSDRMVEDLRRLSMVNDLVASGGRGRDEVPFLFAGPPSDAADAIGALAARVADEVGSVTGALRDPDLWLLDRLLGGSARDRGELLSFLLFDAAFTRPAAQLGAEHAHASVSVAGTDSTWALSLRG